MIGNDIIDLKAARVHSRWQEQRFLDALFTHHEQSFILKDDQRFKNIWYLWSMKESAYKIMARHLKHPKFNPKYFNCEPVSDVSGIVYFGDKKVTTMTESNQDYIYTTASVETPVQFSRSSILQVSSITEQSAQLKSEAIELFSELKSVSKATISIEKDPTGIPQFFINGKMQDHYLTLTHHGHYGAFAMSFC